MTTIGYNLPPNTNDESKSCFTRDVVVTLGLRFTDQPDLISLSCPVFFHILLGTLEDLNLIFEGMNAVLEGLEMD
jgi:hypothetical protein